MEKKILEEYKAEVSKIWKSDQRMIDYCCKKASAIIKLSTGQLMEFETPKINTAFCFGYSDDMDGKDRKDALNMAEYARANEKYFKNRNLSDLREAIERYEGNDEERWLQPYITHLYRDYGVNIVTIVWLSDWDAKDSAWQYNNDLTPLKKEDRQLILNAYKKELEKFEKRLNTYLKRYGLSKVRSWTYWRDE